MQIHESINKFNKLFEYYFSKKNNITDKDKNYICSTGFDIMNKNNDTMLNDDIIGKLIILFPRDVSLYSKMGLIYKNNNISKSILWHTIGFNIDPTCQENTVNLCSLYFENGMSTQFLELNQNNLFDKFINNDKFLGIYARCNFQQLYYKNGIGYLMKLIDNTNKMKIVTKEEKIEKWKNYHDAGYVFVKLGEHVKSLEYTQIAVDLANKYNLDLPKKMLSFSNVLVFRHFNYNNNNTTYEIHTKVNDYYPDKPMSAKHEKIMKQRKNVQTQTKENSKINIGYVSGDYTYHPIANFMIPILENHNKNKFEIFLYSNQNNNEVVDLFLNLKVTIHYILHKTDEEVAEIIKSHKIDILFDLSGHSVMNRLGIFSYNPAPIQITYLGYPNTTGLKSMHYRITDHIADHDNTTQTYSESLLRLPKCFLFYKNVMDPIPQTPKKTEKTIILGAINKEDKNSKYVMYTWKQILKQCPNTKILIKLESFDNNEDRMEFYTTHLETTPDRVIIVNKLQNKEYNEVFTKFDILLDTFPYSGTTTTCNTLHNSVPIVTLYHKDYHVNNVSASLLINASMPELVAYSIEEYIDIVKNLVNNPSRIDQYKKEIGPKFLNLMQANNFMPYYEAMLLNVYNKYYYNNSFQETNCLINQYQDFVEKSKIGYDFSKIVKQENTNNTTSTQIVMNDDDTIEIDIDKNNIKNTNKLETSKSQKSPVLFISVFDYGSINLGLNHLQSLRKANINNYMAYVTDEQSYQMLIKHNFNATKLNHNYFVKSEPKNFGTKEFTEFSFLRYQIIYNELTNYEAVWYLDVDTVVLQDLNKYYNRYKNGAKKYDIIYQNDMHQIKHCTGCTLYFSNPKTLNATQFIYNGINPNIPDQHYTHYFLENYGKDLHIGLFETYEFPNGLLYFDNEDLIDLSYQFTNEKQQYHNKTNKVTAFVHANWMIGINNKINALKKKNLWFLDNIV